jgi:16S rRNA (guanine966-N2)-methyltransferase
VNKGAIFSMLEALAYKRGIEPDEDGTFAAALAWPRVLDLFAGSGALGIEALSRGATSADFVEQDRAAARILDANLHVTQLEERAHVHVGRVDVVLQRLRGPFDAVFADPPYTDARAVGSMFALLGERPLLLPTSVVVLEQPGEAEPPSSVAGLLLSSTRRHGRTRLTLYAGAGAPDANV